MIGPINIAVSERRDLKPSSALHAGGLAAVIGAGSLDAAVVREVHWLAKESGVPLTIYLIAPLEPWLSALMTPQADQIRRLTELLGARVVNVAPKGAFETITSDWREEKPGNIVFGPRKQWPWDIGLSRNIENGLKAFAIEHEIPTATDSPIPPEAKPHLAWRLDHFRPWYHDYVVSLFAVCIAALAVQWLKNLMPAENLSIVFLTAVIFSATAYGFAASLFASLISVALFDFFFVSPAFSFSLSSPDNVLLVILFVLVSGITSNLAGRLRDQAEAAQLREGEARALFQLTRDIATSDKPEDTFKAVVRQSAGLFDTETVILLPHSGSSGRPMQTHNQTELEYQSSKPKESSVLQPVYPPISGLSGDDIEAARWAYSHNQSSGQGTGNFSVLDTFFRPLATANGVVGVLAIKQFDGSLLKEPKFVRMLESVCRLAAVAVERARQAQELEDARVVSQTESLRSALL